jgi:hypothetical protein
MLLPCIYFCFFLPTWGGMAGHEEIRAGFRRFLSTSWEELSVEHFLWA